MHPKGKKNQNKCNCLCSCLCIPKILPCTHLSTCNMQEKLVLKFTAKLQSQGPGTFSTINHLFPKPYQFILYNLRLSLKAA